MYTINGVALDNPVRGWSEHADSDDLAEFSPSVTVLRIPGRDGYPVLSTDRLAPRLTLLVWTPGSGVEDLYALFTRPVNYLGLEDDATRQAEFQAVVGKPRRLPTVEDLVEVSIGVSLVDAAWRDVSESTSSAVNLSSASVDTSVFADSSAPVSDAVVRVKGVTTVLRVEDSAGSWFTYAPSIPSGSYLRFHADTGEAFVTTSDAWTGGTDVSGDIDFGGPRGGFEITPKFTTDPSTRAGVLTVTTATRSGAQIQVRGKGAYLV